MSRIANAEGASPTPLPVQVPPITTVSSAAPPASSSGNAGRHDHEHADAAPAGHDRHRGSPLLHVAHQPAAGPFLERKPQPIRRDPSVLDARRRDDEPGRRTEHVAATQPADGGRARPA